MFFIQHTVLFLVYFTDHIYLGNADHSLYIGYIMCPTHRTVYNEALIHSGPVNIYISCTRETKLRPLGSPHQIHSDMTVLMQHEKKNQPH